MPSPSVTGLWILAPEEGEVLRGGRGANATTQPSSALPAAASTSCTPCSNTGRSPPKVLTSEADQASDYISTMGGGDARVTRMTGTDQSDGKAAAPATPVGPLWAVSSTGRFRVPTRTAPPFGQPRTHRPTWQSRRPEGSRAELPDTRGRPASRIRRPGLVHATHGNLPIVEPRHLCSSEQCEPTPTATGPNSRAADSVRSGEVDDPTGQNERFRRSQPCIGGAGGTRTHGRRIMSPLL